MAASPILRHVVIIGAGFGGVALAIRLRKIGVDDFTLLERADDVGGVWRANTYPGAACDVQSRLYSYSFEQDYDWASRFAQQREILAYIRYCATKYGVLPNIRFGCAATEASYDAATGSWLTKTEDGQTFRSRMLVSAVGLFNRPLIPPIKGLEAFRGTLFHSAEWKHDVDLSSKNVAVIGTGASAIQFAPLLAARVGKLYVVQRSAQYVLPKPRDRQVAQMRWFHDTSLWRRLERLRVWWEMERGIPRRSSRRMTAEAEKAFLDHLRSNIPDAELRRKLTPGYSFGCKRVLLSNDWYPMFRRPNVELVDDPLIEITADGFLTGDGTFRAVDAIVLNTGFRTTEYIVPMKVKGMDGVELTAAWSGKPEAYLGMAIKGFPNFFMMYGPNTNTAASIVYILECQARYIAAAAAKLKRTSGMTLSVRGDAQAAFNARVRRRLAKTVMAAPGCRSYFKTDSGEIVTQWPGFMLEYRFKTAFVNMRDFVVENARGPEALQPSRRSSREGLGQ